MQLKGANILLTGGTGGLGQCLSRRLRACGANVTTAGRDNGEDVYTNFSDPQELERFCRDVAKMPVDILINNAGLQYFGRTHEQPGDSVQAMIAVNVETPIRLTQAVLPGMLARGGGKIVNIGSAFANISFPHFGVYCATKAAIQAFSRSLRLEYADRGIGVTYIAPRAIQTAMSQGPVFELLTRTKSVMDPPDTIAKIIVRAIEKDRKEVSIGFSERLFGNLVMLMPSVGESTLCQSRVIGNEILAAHKI